MLEVTPYGPYELQGSGDRMGLKARAGGSRGNVRHRVSIGHL